MDKVLQGIVASMGITEGLVKTVTTEADMDKVQRGDILVVKFTSPNLTPALIKASAIVTDLGGMLCHAAIVARELGIPAIVGTGEATKKLFSGMRILVKAEGITGEVFSLDD